ncbi:MAG: TIGR03086 family metal-binding protein [Propionibacteriaceae bacterium]|nr:TIGR03086 family metal-binding protein [Propionibacteriaceae bacterium]
MTYSVKELLLLGIEAVDSTLDDIPDFEAPSPCEGWKARDVLAHVTGTLGKAHGVLTESSAYAALPFDPETDRRQTEDVVAAWREVAHAVSGALADVDLSRVVESPRGPETAERALGLPVADLAVHAWDLAASAGRSIDLPGPLLDAVRTQVDSLPEQTLRQPGLFGPPISSAAGASETESLMAWLGRQRP